MKPRYIMLIVTCNDGGRAYVVADRTKIFFDEKKARAVRDCLNEQDAEIVRALGLEVDEERAGARGERKGRIMFEYKEILTDRKCLNSDILHWQKSGWDVVSHSVCPNHNISLLLRREVCND